MAQVLPSPDVSVASAEAMEEDLNACLMGASIVHPVVHEESVPVVPAVAPLAAPAQVDDANASSQSVVEDDNAASQDCPSLPFSCQQAEASFDLYEALEFLQERSLPLLQDNDSDVSASSTCTSFSDQLRADQLQELLGELPAGSTNSDVESPVPQH